MFSARLFLYFRRSARQFTMKTAAQKNTHIHLSGRVNRRFFRTKAFTQTTRVGCMPEPPYLRETKTYHSQPVNSIRHAGNYFATLSIRPTFIFFVAEVMSNYLTTDGLKKFSLLPEAPLRPKARGICHICHMVNPALGSQCCDISAATSALLEHH